MFNLGFCQICSCFDVKLDVYLTVIFPFINFYSWKSRISVAIWIPPVRHAPSAKFQISTARAHISTTFLYFGRKPDPNNKNCWYDRGAKTFQADKYEKSLNKKSCIGSCTRRPRYYRACKNGNWEDISLCNSYN
ncbi:uncharacterized protein LOC110935622 isoform X2 [Helianthus annuus]|uniref:uncharacterized protein LOC110935622 isoform X2 n=1 Tax=Helianthus annuus TaxID=4232 RepID=UPI000B8FA66E|nr:uncharacterized protein LOC110935622 isoform X2 [Helianthus annuus]XP_022033688.1 uncharacterized protein LOC110935622 isoform X2 [Helianthus annuus]